MAARSVASHGGGPAAQLRPVIQRLSQSAVRTQAGTGAPRRRAQAQQDPVLPADARNVGSVQTGVNGIAFLTWCSHRRTTGLASALGIELVELLSERRGAARYWELMTRTVRLLRARSFQVIVAQNPSLVLAALLAFMRSLWGFRLVVDAHNEAVTPFVHDAAWVRAM